MDADHERFSPLFGTDRAAKRTGKRVRSWDVDGKVYAELVDAPAQLPIEAVADVSEI